MKKIMLLSAVFVLLCLNQLAAQWSPSSAGTNDPITRFAVTGVGFPNAGAAGTAANGRSLFILDGMGNGANGNILAHRMTGLVGDFAGKWSGIGEGNPGNFPGVPNPYGLSIVDNNNVGFFNLFPRSGSPITRDLVVGFGISGGANTNRFILRDYSGASASVGRDLMTAFPGGATSFNLDPTFTTSPATLFVDAARDLTGVPKDIVISSTQKIGNANSTLIPPGTATSVSAIGVQQNASLTTSGIAVEGFRAQIPTFPGLGIAPSPANLGGAVNLQVVRSPFGGQFNQSPIDFIASQASTNNPDYAELSWQDFGYGGVVSATDCNALPIDTAQKLDKFFISFRNN